MTKKLIFLLIANCIAFFCHAQWTGLHIGNESSVTGSFTEAGNQMNIISSGVDIWNAADDFFFVYQVVCGDFQITTKMESMANSGTWAKAGLMVRESLLPGSAYGMITTFQPNNNTGTCFQARTATGANSQSFSCAGVNTNTWYRLTRNGNLIISEYSPNGSNWTQISSLEMDFSNMIFLGLAATSFNASETGNAVFSETSLTSSPTKSMVFWEAESVFNACCYHVQDDNFTSEGKYLKVKSDVSQSDTPQDGIIAYSFTSCVASNQKLWARVIGKETGENRFWYRVNNGVWQLFTLASGTDNWTWVPLSAETFLISSGENTLEIAYNTPGFSIDRFLITDDPEFVPVGFGLSEVYGPEIYLSNSGDDSNSGVSEDQPWKTIEKLNSVMAGLVPGTTVLFKAGDTFEGEIKVVVSGTSDNPVTFTSYEEGEKPVISGAKIVSGWQQHDGQIYSANWSHGKPAQLYVDSIMVHIARYPNYDEGFLFNTNTQSNSNTGFSTGQLNLPKEVVLGSTVRFRSNAWTWEHRTVAEYENGVVVFNNPAQYNIYANNGFYLDDKLPYLDTSNEWVFDAATGKIYLWFPEGKSPDNATVYASVFKTGFDLPGNQSNVTIENLHIDKHAVHAIKIGSNASQKITILNNTITHTYKTAINLKGSDLHVVSNTMHDLANNAIYGHNLDNVNISFNDIRRVGLNFAYGESGQHNTCGIYLLDSRNALISHNRLDSIGYGGILAYCDNSIIEKNVVTYAGLTLNDVGALYCWGNNCKNSTWRNNIGMYTYGNRNGTGGINENLPSSMGFGLYLDNNSSWLIAENNTIAYNGSGMHANAGSNNIWFINNISYKNNSNQLLYSNFAWLGDGPIHGMKSEQNILFASNIYNRVFLLKGTDTYNMGTVDKNYYMNPWDHEGLMTSNIEWTTWVENMNDHNSKLSFYTLGQNDEDPSELLVNKTAENVTLELTGGYVDINNDPVASVELAPFSSKVVIKDVGFNQRTTIVSLIENADFHLYPNPALDYIYVKKLPHNTISIECIDSQGKIILSLDGQDFNGIVDISNLRKGVYIIKVNTTSGFATSKFMKG
jgi:regulation of enolase protein 1 (concanavalin A-like superfamily)